MPETTTTIPRDDGTVVIVTTDGDGNYTAEYVDGGRADLTFREELRAWDALRMAAEDDDGSDALFEARRDGRAA